MVTSSCTWGWASVRGCPACPARQRGRTPCPSPQSGFASAGTYDRPGRVKTAASFQWQTPSGPDHRSLHPMVGRRDRCPLPLSLWPQDACGACSGARVYVLQPLEQDRPGSGLWSLPLSSRGSGLDRTVGTAPLGAGLLSEIEPQAPMARSPGFRQRLGRSAPERSPWVVPLAYHSSRPQPGGHTARGETPGGPAPPLAPSLALPGPR